ncbi:sensor histidine kinase [Streptomyces sp. NPDC017941]|uniref:sensor histidine kinase n=1 Tax=Streptomyces sp. NPDC017941 TaxID=3365018 RepID=UPI0037BCBA17
MRNFLVRRLRVTAGVLLGFLSAGVELVLTLASGLWLLVTLGRSADERRGETPILAGARRWAGWQRRRMTLWYGPDPTGVTAPLTGMPALAYVSTRWTVGVLGGVVLLAAVSGAGYASLLVWGWFWVDLDRWPVTMVLSGCGGLFLLFLSMQGVHAVALMDEQLARHFLSPSDRMSMQRRIGELAESRAGVVQAVHDERRRIERDLHDGVQQRLVALGMLLGRARRAPDPGKSAELLRQAHEESQQALVELREVAWRVYPAALDEGGLAAALESVAERAAIPVRLSCDLRDIPPPTAQAVAYFVAAEAVTNAVKHSGAGLVTVRADRTGTLLRLCVEDDGRGGADPCGSGLLGLTRRVAALDGTLTVASPAGGPTVITAELPCV